MFCRTRCAKRLYLLRTSSSAQSFTFPRLGSSSPTPMIDVLYALLATVRSSFLDVSGFRCARCYC